MFLIKLLFYTSVLKSQILNWQPVDDVDGYIIKYEFIKNVEDCSPETWLKYSVDVGPQNSYDLSQDINFQFGAKYKLQVQAYSGIYFGDLSETASCFEYGKDLTIKKLNIKKKTQ
jgi:hypothetical protein